MATTNQPNYKTNLNGISTTLNDNTSGVKYFNNYFAPDFQVSSNVDAAILSYFETVADNVTAAKALASAVIYTSYTQNTDPMTVLKEFSKYSGTELNAYLTMFLNIQRVGTSYLGISNQPVANKYVARAILS